jgi:TetR/AcrR family transcriptional regulator, transcriptional repressor of bet genes
MKDLGSATQKSARGETMKDQIAMAAYELLGEGGWESATMRSIAARAGVSLGLVQHYFSTKDATLRWALQTGIDMTMSKVREIAASPGRAADRLAALLIEFVPESGRRQHFWRFWIALWSGAAFNEAIRRELARSYLEYRGSLSELLAEALAEAGRDPAIAPSAARDLAALVDGAGLQAALGDPEMTTDEMYATCQRYLTFIGVAIPDGEHVRLSA